MNEHFPRKKMTQTDASEIIIGSLVLAQPLLQRITMKWFFELKGFVYVRRLIRKQRYRQIPLLIPLNQ